MRRIMQYVALGLVWLVVMLAALVMFPLLRLQEWIGGGR